MSSAGEAPVREEDASSEEGVRLLARYLLDSLNHGLLQALAAELLYQLVVINASARGDLPGSHRLLSFALSSPGRCVPYRRVDNCLVLHFSRLSLCLEWLDASHGRLT